MFLLFVTSLDTILIYEKNWYVCAQSCPTLWTVAHQAPLFMGFLRQEYWTGLPFPTPGNLPNPGIKPASPVLAGRFFTTESPGKPHVSLNFFLIA